MDPELVADDLLAATTWAEFGAVLDQAGVDATFVDGQLFAEFEARKSRIVQVQQLVIDIVKSQSLA